jgi:hypothetical protein
MNKEQLKRIFEFLEDNQEHRTPFMWKHKNNIPLTDEDLNIEGDLNLSDINITSLPKGLKVRGYLDLRFSSVTSLPEGLKVGDDLYLHYSKITSLPEDLKVGGNLHIGNTLLKKYTNNELRGMIKSGFIKGRIIR